MLQTLAYYLAFLIIGLATASFGPGLPEFARNTGASLAALANLFLFHRIGYIAGSLGGGRLLDRTRGNRLTGLVLLVIALGLLSVSLAGTLPILLGSILLLGLAQGTAETGANTGVVRLHGREAGPYMNGLHLSFGVGALLSPILVSISRGGTGSFRSAYGLFAALAVLAGIWILRLPEPRAESRNGAGGAGRNPLLAGMLACLLFFTIAGEAGFANWVFSYARNAGLASEAGAGLLTSVFWTSLTLGRLVGIALVRRLGPARLLSVILPGALTGSLVFLAVPGEAWALWTASVLLGFFQASVVPAAFSYAGDRGILRGSVAGFLGAASSLGGMALPWLIGRYFESSGGAVFPALVAASQAAALACLAGVRLLNGRFGRDPGGPRANSQRRDGAGSPFGTG